MDLVTFAFLALIALVSGGIAVFADWLGRKLGKKRLRLGALRPRHTAALGVFSSGVMISLFTIGLVYALSSDVRQWIRDGRIAIRELNAAQTQRDAAIAESNQINRANARLSAEVSRRQSEIDKANLTLSSLKERTRSLQHQIDANRAEAIKKLDTVLAEYKTSIQNLQLTEQRRKQVELSLAGITKQFGALKDSYRTLSSSYKQLSAQTRDIETYNTTVTRDNLDLTETNRNLDKTRKDLEAKNQDAANSLSLLNREVNRQTKQLELQTATLDDLAKQELKLSANIQFERTHTLTFAVNEELARTDLAARATTQEVRDAITSLMREARTVAESRGAKAGKVHGAELPAAAIYEREDANGQTVSPEQIIDSMVRRVAGRPTEQVIVATSTLNGFVGEPVSVDLTAYPNPLVYKAGHIVAEGRIDGTDDEKTILANVDKFIKQKVHDRAKSDHLIPSGDDSFGQVDGDEIIQTVKNVQSANRWVRLQAIARHDTRAGDPLQIDLRVR